MSRLGNFGPAGGRVTREPLLVHLEGEGIGKGEVDARTLATALNKLADLTQAASKVGDYAEHSTPALKIVATAPGSFELSVVLEAIGEWWGTTRAFLLSDDVAAINQLGSLVAIAVGVMKALPRVGRRAIKKVQQRDDGQAEIELEDGTTLTAPTDVVEAVQTPEVQAAAKNLAAVTLGSGIDSLTINAETVNLIVRVDAADAAKFPDPAEAAPEDNGERYTAWVTFTRPHFDGDKWTMGTARGTRQVTILDHDFLERVDHGFVSLSKYSEFRVEVREEPYRTPKGQTRFRRYVTRVLEEREGTDAQQPELEAEGGP